LQNLFIPRLDQKPLKSDIKKKKNIIQRTKYEDKYTQSREGNTYIEHEQSKQWNQTEDVVRRKINKTY